MRAILFFILLCGFGPLKAQQLLSEKVLRAARAFDTDEIGNTYIVYEDNSLVQYNAKGDSINNFRSIQNGKLSHIDTRNPLKILLFYPDFNKIVILDRMLSKKNEIDLRQLRLFNVSAVCMAMDGNIWVYDNNNVQLLKIDENLNVLNRSDDLRSAIRSFPEPIFMEEGARKVYLLDTLNGIFVFDQFANYLNTLNFEGAKALQTYDQLLVYQSGSSLFTFNPLNFTSTKMVLPNASGIIATRIEKDKLFLLYKNKLDCYSLAP